MRRVASRGVIGRFRRTYLVPVPEVATLAELNDRIAAACITDLRRTIRGRQRPSAKRSAARSSCCARCRRSLRHGRARNTTGGLQGVGNRPQNQYSLPVRLAGLRVAARIGAREIVFMHDGREVAWHDRLHGRFGTSAQLDHYLELLKVKAGALARSLALRQERDRGRWPESSTSSGTGSRTESAPRVRTVKALACADRFGVEQVPAG